MRLHMILKTLNKNLPTKSKFTINNENLEAFKSAVRKSITEAPQVISAITASKKKTFYGKLIDLNKWYLKVIGLEEVKYFHDRVLQLQEQLQQAQEKRRLVSKQLQEIRQKAVELQTQLQTVNKQDQFDQYFALMKQEGELLRLEKSITVTFQDYDRTERELFTLFTNAIRDSYEKQREQVEYTKYFGLVLGIVASFLTFVFSTIKKYDLKCFIEEKLKEFSVNDVNASNIFKEIMVQKNELETIKFGVSELLKNHQHYLRIEQKESSKLNEVIGTVNESFTNSPAIATIDTSLENKIISNLKWILGGAFIIILLTSVSSR